MARESYTSSTLGGPMPPTRVEPELHRHTYTMKLKTSTVLVYPKIDLGVTCPFLQFWTPEHQRTTWTTLTLTIPNLSPANPPILEQTYTELVL